MSCLISSAAISACALAEIYSYTYGIFVIGAGIGPVIFGASFDANKSYSQILTIAEITMAVSVVLMALLGRYVFAATQDRTAAMPD